jgi:hypothetical protein
MERAERKMLQKRNNKRRTTACLNPALGWAMDASGGTSLGSLIPE